MDKGLITCNVGLLLFGLVSTSSSRRRRVYLCWTGIGEEERWRKYGSCVANLAFPL
jgi:hypothetical protein